jgi:hypothetical protein
MNRNILLLGGGLIVLVILWMLFKSKKKTGNYSNLHTYYDTLTDRLDAKLGYASSSMIQQYLDPENCPYYGDLPSLSRLVKLKHEDPQQYVELLNNGTVKRAVNMKALKTWLLLGSSNKDKFERFMNKVNQLNIDKIDMLNLENALKVQLSKNA